MTQRIQASLVIALSFLAFLSTDGAKGQPSPRQRPIKLRVLLPTADAQLVVDDMPTRQTGVTRNFISPPMDPNQAYSYTIKATWAPNNYTTIIRTRVVIVTAGQDLEADLRQADDKSPDKIVVRWVPTPQEVVNAMLKLAAVGKDDVVYDLGCGDGRIVSTAVSKFGARHAVGVDLDPKWVEQSKARAKLEKVEDKVEIRQGDVLDIKDLSSATVVTLYMGEDVNLRLRPILLKTLKPGSRVVSHRFTMGDWKPLKTETIVKDGENYSIHLWQIPAEGAGK